jgi:hypothetical protein
MVSELIALIANIALALSFVVGLVFGIAQVRAAARDRRERLTLEALRNFQSREFAELMHYIISRDMPKSRKELEARPAEEWIIFIQFAQEMESLGMLVAEGFIDIDLVDKTLGSLVTTAWDKYKVMFLDTREMAPDPYLGEYFQWLAESVAERMKTSPREPYYKMPKVR